jgi:hypothetical protein
MRISMVGWCFVLLAACTTYHGPTDGEVEAALKARFDINSGNRPDDPRLLSAKNQKCVEWKGPSQYDCSVEIETAESSGPKSKGVTHAIVEKIDGAWTTRKLPKIPESGASS